MALNRHISWLFRWNQDIEKDKSCLDADVFVFFAISSSVEIIGKKYFLAIWWRHRCRHCCRRHRRRRCCRRHRRRCYRRHRRCRQ